MHSLRIVAAIAVLIALASPDAAAQPLRQRFWLSINAGMQVPPADLSDRFAFDRSVETGSADIDYDSEPGIHFDGGIGFRFSRQLGAAVFVSRMTHDAGAQIDASIPHPFFDNRLREISGTIDGVTRSETGVHMQLTYTIDSGGPLRVTLSGGPTYLSVEQELVTAVRHADSFPFDEAEFATADTARPSSNAMGFNVGADVTWMLGRQFGLGGLVRYTRASVDLDWTDADSGATRTIAVKGGGIQAGAGIRILF